MSTFIHPPNFPILHVHGFRAAGFGAPVPMFLHRLEAWPLYIIAQIRWDGCEFLIITHLHTLTPIHMYTIHSDRGPFSLGHSMAHLPIPAPPPPPSTPPPSFEEDLEQVMTMITETQITEEELSILLTSYPIVARGRGRGGHTLLWKALRDGDLPAADALLACGADLHAHTDAGRSLLLAAVDGDHAASAEWLVTKWYQKQSTQTDMHTQMQMHMQTEDDLVEERTSVGYTALWWCGMDGRVEVAGRLLFRGADDWSRDRNGISCLDIAIQRREWHVVQLYRECERAYFLWKMWWLMGEQEKEGNEEGKPERRATGPEEEEEGNLVEQVAYFATQRLPLELLVELDMWMRGSV